MAKRKTNQAAEGGYELLKADLRDGSFRRLYVFFGEERYLLDYYRQQLKKHLVDGPAEDFNYHRFSEETWDLGAFSEAVEAIPMMSQWSLVEVADVDPFSLPERDRQELAELFSALPDYCTVIWDFDTVEWKPDKRMKKLWEALDRAALQVEFQKQPESQLIPWIRRHLAKEQKTMENDLCRYLILLTGGSMTTLSAEIEKLVRYSDQPVLTRHDIDAVVITVMEAAVFDITRDIGSRNFDGALQKLQNLFRQDTEPISVNAVIGRQLRQLYGAKVLSEHGKGPAELTRICGIWDSAAREVYSQARSMDKQMLKKAMDWSAQADYAMKTSGGDSEEIVETLLLRLAQAAGGRQ